MNGFGSITTEGETYTLRFERLLTFAREEVWAALTEPARMADWLADATVRPGPEGEITLDFGEGARKAVASPSGNRLRSWSTSGTSSARDRPRCAGSSRPSRRGDALG